MVESDYNVRDFVAYVFMELRPFDLCGLVSFEIPVRNIDDGKWATISFSVNPKSFYQKYGAALEKADRERRKSFDAAPGSVPEPASGRERQS